MRAPFQVLIIPYRFVTECIEYCVLERSDENYWQFIAGGGEDNDTPYEAAIRETFEEIGIRKLKILKLDSVCMVPVVNIAGFQWGPTKLVIPEYAFGTEILSDEIINLSREHTNLKWLDYNEAILYLKWDSNRTALWELNHRLQNNIFNEFE